MGFLDDAIAPEDLAGPQDDKDINQDKRLIEFMEKAPKALKGPSTFGSDSVAQLIHKEEVLRKAIENEKGFFSSVLTAVGVEPLSKELRGQIQRQRRRLINGTESETEAFKDEAIDVVKQVTNRTAKAAPMLIAKAPNVAMGLLRESMTFGLALGGFKTLEELSESEDLDESVKKGVITGVGSSVLNAAIGGVLRVPGAVKNLISKNYKKPLPKVLNFFSGVDDELIEEAITHEVAGKSWFKAPYQPKLYETLGKRAQKVANMVRKDTGQAIENEVNKALVKYNGKTFDTAPLFNKIKRLKKEAFYLNAADKRNIDELLSIITPKTSFKEFKTIKTMPGAIGNIDVPFTKTFKETTHPGIRSLFEAKQMIDDKVTFRFGTVKDASSRGETLLKDIRFMLDTGIDNLSIKSGGDLGKANLKYEKIMNLRQGLRAELKDKSIERTLKNFYKKSEYTKQLLIDLDKIAPKGHKFMTPLKKNLVRESFGNLLPKGSQIESASRFGVGFIAPYLAPLMSPVVLRQTIKSGVKLGQAKFPIAKGAAIAGKRLGVATGPRKISDLLSTGQPAENERQMGANTSLNSLIYRQRAPQGNP